VQDVGLIKGVISELSLYVCTLNKSIPEDNSKQHSAALIEVKEYEELSEG